MKLAELLNGIDINPAGTGRPYNQYGQVITGVAADSRKVVPGCLFICVRGLTSDGHEYIREAAAKGAAAALCEYLPENAPENVVYLLTKDTRAALAVIASNFHEHPEAKLKLVGVTGTKGKTSVTYYLKSILERAGHKTGIIGTTGAFIGDKPIDVEYQTSSTPDILELYEILGRMAGEGAEYCVMEATSHGLDQGRTDGLSFSAGIFTNLQHDHLDYHKTIDNYAGAKGLLFKQSGAAVVNFDDAYKDVVLNGCSAPVIYYGIGEMPGYFARDIELMPNGSRFSVNMKGRALDIRLNVPGRFSVYNALAAIAAAGELGIPGEAIIEGLKGFNGVRGRFERVENSKGFSVIIDYAHNPESLENIITAVREITPEGRVITVFGCGGDRDAAKRPIMGGIAGRLSDICVITSDNPRNENPDDIINQILPGVDKTGITERYAEPDRKKAIYMALYKARPGDAVIIAGKGHELYQEFEGRRREAFDDRAVALEALDWL
ncbi:MAG: UDP-N-acetylmuramoyl-L-alanyl-D-glutamate--2,6-diaminopimelate ligase [Clostridiales bacterium]|jgi:UDP-N-acetylmuramoyl-L-alanyl-D-glutamate--2,6-diaminopimelate ligase|nr:UDP-N-acetylmuramoyl-L-alanyl-D-glutamate--2,6-diaminopimelate ligase [Clostridiales bacterium]